MTLHPFFFFKKIEVIFSRWLVAKHWSVYIYPSHACFVAKIEQVSVTHQTCYKWLIRATLSSLVSLSLVLNVGLVTGVRTCTTSRSCNGHFWHRIISNQMRESQSNEREPDWGIRKSSLQDTQLNTKIKPTCCILTLYRTLFYNTEQNFLCLLRDFS